MPWSTPNLRTVREMVRNDITSALSGAVLVGNSVLRVMSDAMAGLAHLTLRYLDWLSKQLLPDTSEKEWLDRHGNIWLINADSTIGRKTATYASGTVSFTGLPGLVVPIATQLAGLGIHYETTQAITVGTIATNATVRALDPGSAGNLAEGDTINLVTAISGVDSKAIVILMEGGNEDETDDDLRARVLFRIQRPPMGGDADDYVLWSLANPGVTRAWVYPLEMGIGTVTVRFLLDDLRANNHGLPNSTDIAAVQVYLDSHRPVAVKDFFVEAPLPFFYTVTITNLSIDTPDVRAKIAASILAMEKVRMAPGQTIYKSWVDEAISIAVGENHHELIFETTAMPSPGYLPICGTIGYV